MKLVVGLGNWGSEYSLTRHNFGFMVLDNLIPKLSIKDVQESNQAKLYFDENNNLFVYPKVLMNNTGQVVSSLALKYNIELTNILVIRDDIDLPFGKIRGPVNLTGSGGHRGVESIIKSLSSTLFYQIKFGFGRPSDSGDVDDFVLAKIPSDQLKVVELSILEIVRRIAIWLEDENKSEN